MKQEKIFPAVAVQMVALGEESGKLDDLLTRTADFFDQQVDMTIQNMTSLLEPVMVIGLGAIVLVMSLSVFLPMWNLVYVFKK
jgi:type IV pilus assembly protein PilC